MIKLPDKKGFPQRHSTMSRPTQYLNFVDFDHTYSRSPVTLDLIRKDLFQYYNKTKKPTDPLFRAAVSRTASQFNVGVVHPVHLVDVINNVELDIWDASPCYPWVDYGYKTKKSVVAEARNVDSIRKYWSLVKSGGKVYPADCMAHIRAHLIKNGDPPKVRAVWGYPLTMVLGEAMFALPYIRAVKRSSTPMAYGYETAVGGARKIVRELKSRWKTTIDFSSFDKTVPNWLIEIAFNIIESSFDMSRYTSGESVNYLRVWRCFQHVKEYFLNTPIRLCNGERYRKTTGVPSGSYFTQMIDSIVNSIIINYLYLKQHTASPEYLRVMGDDSITGSKFRFCLDLAQTHAAEIGMVINVKKSATSIYIRNLEFLGYELRDGYPWKSYDKWICSLAYPERPDRSWDDFASRALGLGYANAAIDDKFDNVVRFVLSLGEFELSVGRHLRRWLASQGVYKMDLHLPSRTEFMLKMAV